MPISLTLKRAHTFIRLSDQDRDDDFDVLDDSVRVGRIYFQHGASEPWRWSLSHTIAAGVKGCAASRAAAVASLTQAYEQTKQPVAKTTDI